MNRCHAVVFAVVITSLVWAGFSERSYGLQEPPPTSGEGVAKSGVATVYGFSSMYDEVNPSIAKVFADSSHGSGFLVDDRGLIATNHHVVRNSRYLAVQFANGLKHRAAVVTEDAENDIAILWVNKQVVQDLALLELLPES